MRTLFATLSQLMNPYYNIADSLSALSGLTGSIAGTIGRSVHAFGSAMASAQVWAWKGIEDFQHTIQEFFFRPPKPKLN